MRLQGKLILIFLFLSIVPLAISSVFMVGTLNQEVSQRIEDVQTEELSILAARMSWSLEQTSREIRQVVESFRLEELSEDEITGLMRLLYRQVPQVNAVMLIDQAGRPRGEAARLALAPEPGSGLVGHAPVSDEELAILTDPAFLSRAHRSIVTWGSAIPLRGSVFPHFPVAVSTAARPGEPGSLVVALVSSAELSDQMGRFAQAMTRTISLADPAGRALLRTGPGGVRVLGDQASDAERQVDVPPELWSTIVSGRAELSLRYHDANREEQLVVFSHIESLDLHLVTVMPTREAFGAVASIRHEIGYWLGVSVLIAVIFAVFFARSLTGPISDLAQAVRSVGSGDFRQSVEIHTRDEIGDLSEAFNDMASQLQSQKDEIDRQSSEISAWNVELQERVEARTRELKEAQDYLIHTQKLAAVAELSSGVAHELNNPLAVVLGFVQILKEKHRGEGDSEGPLLLRIEEQAQRCREIVQHLLSFSQAQVDQGGYDRVDFTEVVRTVLRLFDAYFSGRQVQLQDELPMPLFIHGNRGQLLQGMLQLISAVRSTIPRGGVLRLGAQLDDARVTVRLLGSLDGLADVDPSAGPSAFSTEDKDQALSQGLGLWLSQKIVQEHGGHIAIEHGQGATSVVVILPRDGRPGAAVEAAS